MLERWSRSRACFHHSGNKYSKIKRFELTGFRAFLAFIACILQLYSASRTVINLDYYHGRRKY